MADPDPQPVPRFEDVLAQDQAISILRSALESERIHHAWIFSGPHGVGKCTTALAFASMLLDPTLQRDLTGRLAVDPDSRTQALLRAGTHPDLHIIRKELARYSDDSSTRSKKQTNIPIDLLREFMLGGDTPNKSFESRAWKASQMGHGKVFIIDEAELLATAAQNALLKTLEEPPARTWIILVTSQEQNLLTTIRSRCQRVAFRLLPDEAMRAWLAPRAGMLAADDAEAVLRFAAGSPGRAQLAIDTGMHGWVRALDPMLDDAERGRPAPDLGATMHRLVDEWAADWVKRHTNASKESANIAGARYLFSYLGERSRARLARAVEQGNDPGDAQRAIEIIDDAGRQVASHVNLTLVMENLGAQLSVR